MDEKSKPRYREVEGVETTDIENFPYSAIKALGGIQIGLGVACLVLGLIDVILYLFVDDSSVLAGSTTLMSLTISSTPIWCGLWFCVTGCMAACMNKRNKSNMNYFKMTFLVLSILCSALFAPVCCVLNVVMAVLAFKTEQKLHTLQQNQAGQKRAQYAWLCIINSCIWSYSLTFHMQERHEVEAGSYRWMVPILVAFFAFNELVFAITSASICCCCAPIRTTQVRVLLATQNDDQSLNSISKSDREKTNDSLDIFTTSDRQGKPLKKQPAAKDADENKQPYPINPPQNDPPEANEYRPYTKDSSFQKLKRLALPSSSFPRSEEVEPRF